MLPRNLIVYLQETRHEIDTLIDLSDYTIHDHEKEVVTWQIMNLIENIKTRMELVRKTFKEILRNEDTSQLECCEGSNEHASQSETDRDPGKLGDPPSPAGNGPK